MRPFLVYAPGGEIPDGIRRTLVEAGAEALVAASLEEASRSQTRDKTAGRSLTT
jgi:hypothetical protein